MDDRIKGIIANVEQREAETDKTLRARYHGLKLRIINAIYLLYAGAETLEATSLTKRPDAEDVEILNEQIELLIKERPELAEQISAEDYRTKADYLTNDVLYEYLHEEPKTEKTLEDHFADVASGKKDIDAFRPGEEDYKTRLIAQFAAAAAITSSLIIDGIIRGNTIPETIGQIEDLDKKLQKRTKRIVYTEDTWIANESIREGKKYIYTTADDSRVCPVCRALNGKEFAYRDRRYGINYPPMHPWCRCIAMPKGKEKKE